jgi:diadenosine tetraphosphate (Ap4A) HIT family hydrolase
VEARKRDRVGSALRGENPTVMKQMPGGFAVIGDVQWLAGYSLLLTDNPTAQKLSDLQMDEQSKFLTSMAGLARAVETACSDRDPDFVRVNIEILGNADPFLHAHVWPRYAWETSDMLTRPVWLYPETRWKDPTRQLGPEHNQIRSAITALL